MEPRNIVSVSWGDHLLFGEGDGRLASPEALRRRLPRWRDELGAGIVHWRQLRSHIKGRLYAARGRQHPTLTGSRDVDWDDFQVVPRLAHEAGLRAYLYVSLFDDGWPLPPKRVRAVSYHNVMHGQHVAWQSTFSRQHPEYTVVDRTGRLRQWGVLCLAYPEARRHFRERFLGLLGEYEFDGLFVCLRSQSRPADFADQYGFNEPVHRDYLSLRGRDIRAQEFDLGAWRDLLGGYLTRFWGELREALQPLRVRLAVGAARGDVLGPPLGNAALQWREWIERGLVGELVVNQNSSRCPSMWHELWPMHRGYGYLQNYLDGFNFPPLADHLDKSYAPVLAGREARLYVARQWDERSPGEEEALLAHPAVSGLVWSSFRFDNPGPVERGDWRA
jgi:hypothetical protein